MAQLVLMSIVFATFFIPAWVVRRGGGLGYGAVFKPSLVFVAVYVFLLLFVYPRLL